MSEFVKYQHVERYGTDATEGLLDGVVYVFYKLDGTNGSVWCEPKMSGRVLRAGSRNRILELDNDNAGFYNHIVEQDNIREFFGDHPTLRLYGEWLVPHSLKTYTDDAWRRFYVFDVVDTTNGEMLSYEAYKPILDRYKIDYIPPLCIFKNPTEEMLYKALDRCG